uniref:Piezo_RRas_bdg domain-containing protein n=1 Tax=Magallana gigas TaxID=29159 RepID=K1S643_MAGGI
MLTLTPINEISIIGLYVSLVLVVGRFVRVFFSGASTQVMYQELPCVDNILNLCLDIYMVRESQDYRMEEYLFSKLIFLYRSPETLIKWTKFKYS